MMTPMIRTGHLIGRAAGLSMLLALTACGGGGGSAAVATPGPACTDGTGATLALVSPPNGGTGVNVQNTTSIEISASSPVSNTISLVLLDKNGSTQTGTALTSATAPAAGTASFYYQSFGFVLASGDTYTVEFVNAAQAGCTAAAIPSATFST